jgi:hypothetical protein
VLRSLPAGAAWSIERGRQQAEVRRRRNTAVAYPTSHRPGMQRPPAVAGFARPLDRLDLLADLVLVTTTPPGKQPYVSPSLSPTLQKERARRAKPGPTPANVPAGSGPPTLSG